MDSDRSPGVAASSAVRVASRKASDPVHRTKRPDFRDFVKDILNPDKSHLLHLVMSPALTTLLRASGDWGLSFLMPPGEERRGNASPSWYSSFQLTDSDFSTTSRTLGESGGRVTLGESGGRGELESSRFGFPGGADRGLHPRENLGSASVLVS